MSSIVNKEFTIKIWMWESNWKGIKFTELGVNLTFFRRASQDFYTAFYKELFRKYTNYYDLPDDTKSKKELLAESIADEIKSEKIVLSLGCGEGFVENKITEILPHLEIHTYDFADSAGAWINQNNRIKILNESDNTMKYSVIYCSQLLYAISDKEMGEFLGFVKKHLQKDGIFLTVDYSLLPSENGKRQPTLNLFKLKLMLLNLIRPLYYLIVKRGEMVFWGWQRDNKELNKLFLKNGFVLLKNYARVGQSFSFYARQ